MGSRKKATKNIVPASDRDSDIEEATTTTEQAISKTYLEQAIKKLESSLQKGYNNTIDKLNETIDALTQTLNNTKKHCEKLQQEVRELKEDKHKIQDDLKNANKKIQALEERVEERTNRQLRKTLVIRGIPESSSNNSRHATNSSTSSATAADPAAAETWNQSKEKLANAIADVSDISAASAIEMVERAHRSAPNPRYHGTAPRPIFAALYKWPDAERIVEAFRKYNIANPEHAISCDFKYGPLTTKRRNMAFMERKKLKERGEIVSGYVAYPARLMVKTSRRQGTKYICQKDFSHEPVSFGKRD